MLFNYRCGRKGHCLEYDHDGLAQVVVGVFATCKFITMVCFFLSWFFCRRLQAKETMKDVNNEVEEVEVREALTSASAGKMLLINLETAMRKKKPSLEKCTSKLGNDTRLDFVTHQVILSSVTASE